MSVHGNEQNKVNWIGVCQNK